MLVTLTAVRGHAPRDAGAKMVVGVRETWDTVGGGNLEATAVDRARRAAFANCFGLRAVGHRGDTNE